MHEVALAASLLEMAGEELERAGGNRITRLVVRLGALGHVDPHALAFAFEAAKPRSKAAEAALDIVTTPGEAFCMACGTRVTITRREDPCPACGSGQLMLESGDEMRLDAMEIV